MFKSFLFRSLIILVALTTTACSKANIAETSELFVSIEANEDAYVVFTGIPTEELAEVQKNITDNIVLVSIDDLQQTKDRYIKSHITKNEYAHSEAMDGIIQLVKKYPGLPFGLTWNGGIAFTFNDYQYAINTYIKYKEDPAEYESAHTEPRESPVNPQAHIVPLLGY